MFARQALFIFLNTGLSSCFANTTIDVSNSSLWLQSPNIRIMFLGSLGKARTSAISQWRWPFGSSKMNFVRRRNSLFSLMIFTKAQPSEMRAASPTFTFAGNGGYLCPMSLEGFSALEWAENKRTIARIGRILNFRINVDSMPWLGAGCLLGTDRLLGHPACRPHYPVHPKINMTLQNLPPLLESFSLIHLLLSARRLAQLFDEFGIRHPPSLSVGLQICPRQVVLFRAEPG